MYSIRESFSYTLVYLKNNGITLGFMFVSNTVVLGYGIPRYNYVDNIEDGSVQAQVVLPDMRAFTGEFAATREQVRAPLRDIFSIFLSFFLTSFAGY